MLRTKENRQVKEFDPADTGGVRDEIDYLRKKLSVLETELAIVREDRRKLEKIVDTKIREGDEKTHRVRLREIYNKPL